ncbi:MAG: patatin-like phospholipase family protein [Deltaproteobacteria bacterium]|jgi:NTE family protein
MKKAKPSPPLTALSLQGGGALGAYEYGVLKALYAVRGENFVPRVVAGVSIGAINAALLVGARTDAMAALDRLWREKLCVDAAFTPESAPAPAAGENACGIWGTRPGQYLSFFGNPGMYRLKPEYCFMPFCAPFFTSSVYDTSLLKETLAELVDPEKLNRPDKTRLIVTAVDVETGRQAKFDNAETTLTLDHIVASGSFPVSFPPTLIDGRYYWDGGIFMNMPVGVAANALEQIEADNPSAVREIILVSLHRTRGALPETLPAAAERFYTLLFSGKFALDRKLYGKYSAFVDVMQKIDAALPAASPIRKHEGYRDLIRHRKMDRVIVIGEEGTGAVGSGSDFTRRTLERRIADGFNDAMTCFCPSPE